MSTKNFDLEKKRKLFHLQSLIVPIIYLFINKISMLLILSLVTILTVYLDICRNYNPKIKALIDKFFSKIMKSEEKSGNFNFSGATYMALGFLISGLFLPKELAITSWLVLIIADPTAAIVGIRIGNRLPNGKSLEGSIAFFTATFLISLICYFTLGYSTSYFIIVIASLVTTLAEFHAKKFKYLDDNFLIPVVYGFTTFILYFIFNL